MRKAPPFCRFSELDSTFLNVEYQVHTSQTDGEATPKEILTVARERGLESIAFTEHVRRDTDWFGGFAGAIRDLRPDFPEMRIYVGCETKV